MASSSSIVIRPLAPMIAAMARYAEQLYQPPKETIRGIKQDAFYSPLNPVAPFGPPGTEPRGQIFFPGQNLNWVPRFDAEYTAARLKSLATYPLARICIENVKDAIIKASWEFQAKPKMGESRKQAQQRSQGDENILKLSRFFEKPDREHAWDEWLRPLLDDMLVIDAAAVHIRKTFSGELAELVRLPGESIVRYIDNNGLTPAAPDPAYAQNWWGLPLVNLTTDQLLYKPRNIVPRNTVSSQMYGMSPTEQLAKELEIGIERLNFTLAYYTEGSIPGMAQIVPKGISPEKITEAMLATNSELAGNFAKRWQLRLIQGFADHAKGEKDEILLTKAPLLADAYDELHTKRVAFGYGTSPQRLGKTMNRAASEQSDDAAETEGTLPYFTWLKSSVMDYLIRFKLGYMDYEWVPDPFKEPSFEKMAKAINEIMGRPVLTPNEAREKLGEESRPEPEADMLGMPTGTGWVPIGMATAQAGAEIDAKGKVTITKPPDGDAPAGGKPNGKPATAVAKPNGKPAAEDAGKAAHARTNFGFGSAVTNPAIVLGKYSEDEERDERGRWTAGGGGTLADHAKLYSQGLSDGHKISSISAAYIKGESLEVASAHSDASDEHTSAAVALVDSIREAKPENVDMFRATSFSRDDNRSGVQELKNSLLNAKEGQTISLDRISSFSADRAQAAYYGESGKGTVNIEIKVVGQSKSLSTDELTGMGHKERITTGSFEVVGVEKSSTVKLPEEYVGSTKYARTIVVKQRNTF